MPSSPDKRLATALFRLLAARRPGFSAAALFVAGTSSCRLIAETSSFAALREKPERDEEWPIPTPVEPAALLPAAYAVDPAEFGLDARFAAVAPVRTVEQTVGYLVVADRRPRRLDRVLTALLGDAAALASPAIEGPALRLMLAARQEPPPGGSAPPGTIRLRAAAQRVIEAALAQGHDRAAGLMMLDLDRFRAVNEGMGVAAGDSLLTLTAIRIEQALDTAGRLVRLEGDRFVIVARATPSGLRALARRLLSAVSEPLALDGRNLVVHASIGIVANATLDHPIPVLLMQADNALHAAKAEGGNRFVLQEPAQAVAALETSRLELDLPNALASGQMHLAYQPFVDLMTGALTGVEALMRWQHPTRGQLLPDAFIPLAEVTGHILPLGRWALRTALAEAGGWPVPLTLAVNISPLQFHQRGFVAEVDAALAASGFPAERLELEITETVLMRDNPETTTQLRALIARGIKIALDDFGTGYSALAYLARLPHHRIKLDKAFVQDLGNPATADLIRAIIVLARAQGIAVTAEGVERPEHLAMVRRMGFTHAQGYATGAPLTDPALLFGEPQVQACNS